MKYFRQILIALQFMTIIRLKGDLRETSEDMARSTAWYPLVGLFLGAILLGLSVLLGLFLPQAVIAVLLVIALVVLTGGLHLDGLADTADGLFSHQPREAMLEIMKDSRIGVFGGVALILVLGLKAVLIYELLGHPMVLLLFPLMSRLAVTLNIGFSVYAREKGGLGKPFVDLAGGREMIIASSLAMLASSIFLGISGLLLLALVICAALLLIWFWRKKLGGVTGDTLGATLELTDCFGLMAALLII